MDTSRTIAQPGETHRPVIHHAGRTYETTASPTFIRPHQEVEVRPLGRDTDRIRVAPAGTDAWETWEATDA